MTEDLLTRIQQETHERLRELRGAVDEHDRLQAELRMLDTAPELPADLESLAALEIAPEPSVAPEQSTNAVRLPATPYLPRTRMVSPKVARLMRAPRRPALERAGVVRVGAGSPPPDDPWPQELGEEVDAEATLFESSF